MCGVQDLWSEVAQRRGDCFNLKSGLAEVMPKDQGGGISNRTAKQTVPSVLMSLHRHTQTFIWITGTGNRLSRFRTITPM